MVGHLQQEQQVEQGLMEPQPRLISSLICQFSFIHWKLATSLSPVLCGVQRNGETHCNCKLPLGDNQARRQMLAHLDCQAEQRQLRLPRSNPAPAIQRWTSTPCL